VVHATDDPFSEESKAREVAAALGADVALLEGAGHFWPYQTPDAGAACLDAFWSTLPPREPR
jgi:hypothetical protein